MKNVKFRGKKTNSAANSVAQIPRQKPKFRGIPWAAENCGPYSWCGKPSKVYIMVMTYCWI